MDAEGDIHVLLFGLAEFNMETANQSRPCTEHCQGEEQLSCRQYLICTMRETNKMITANTA